MPVSADHHQILPHPIKAEWEETVRQEEAGFERVCQERYEHQLKYHQICLTPNPEDVAHWETDLQADVEGGTGRPLGRTLGIRCAEGADGAGSDEGRGLIDFQRRYPPSAGSWANQ